MEKLQPAQNWICSQGKLSLSESSIKCNWENTAPAGSHARAGGEGVLLSGAPMH